MPAKLKIDNVDVVGKRVFMRVDFNVPQDKKDPTIITNTQRIDGAIPTIKMVLEKGAKSVVLASHLGRPDGCVVEKFSMAPVTKIVEEKLGKPVVFCSSVLGADTAAATADPATGTVILLENLRFNVEEEGKGVDADGNKIKADAAKVTEFRTAIRAMADIYCNDAFGTAHRAHSSMVGEGYSIKCSGFLVAKELAAFDKVLTNPALPVLAISAPKQDGALAEWPLRMLRRRRRRGGRGHLAADAVARQRHLLLGDQRPVVRVRRGTGPSRSRSPRTCGRPPALSRDLTRPSLALPSWCRWGRGSP